MAETPGELVIAQLEGRLGVSPISIPSYMAWTSVP